MGAVKETQGHVYGDGRLWSLWGVLAISRVTVTVRVKVKVKVKMKVEVEGRVKAREKSRAAEEPCYYARSLPR